MLGTCSVNDMLLQYMYSIEFSNSQFTDDSTDSTSYQLMNVTQGIDLEITVTPALPSLGLTGPPLSSTVNLRKLLDPPVCLHSLCERVQCHACKAVTIRVPHACVNVHVTARYQFKLRIHYCLMSVHNIDSITHTACA